MSKTTRSKKKTKTVKEHTTTDTTTKTETETQTNTTQNSLPDRRSHHLRQTAIYEAAESLVQIALDRGRDRLTNETFAYCHMCGEMDNHTLVCAVPAVIRWLVRGRPTT